MAGHRKATLGLALGAGGARGWCNIGVLRELADMDICPDVVAGASMGALVGAIHSHGALDALEDWARGLTARQVMGLVDLRFSSGGLVEGAEVLGKLREFLGETRIEDLPTPLAIVATDMETGREVWLRKGDIACAVRASVALPGILRPVQFEDRWMLDGGLTNPVPVSACHVLGADVVIAVNPNARTNGRFWIPAAAELHAWFPSWRDWVPNPLSAYLGPADESEAAPGYIDTLATTIDIMSDGIMRGKLAGDPPHVLLEADLTAMSVLELHRAGEAIDEGRRIVREAADRIRHLVQH